MFVMIIVCILQVAEVVHLSSCCIWN